MPTDPARLLSPLSRLMGATDFREGELEERLDELLSTAARVFDVAGAGLMLIDQEGQLRSVGASNAAGDALERCQQNLREGPGVEATRTRQVVAVEDFSADPRWPEIARAVEPFGLLSVLSAPLSLREQPIGNLNLFDRVPRQWTGVERDGLVAFTAVAAAILSFAIEAHHRGQLTSRLRRQLRSDVEPDDGEASQ